MFDILEQAGPVISDNAPPNSTRRVVLSISIADPNQQVLFASNFMKYVIGWIWPSGIKADWVMDGGKGPRVLAWEFFVFPIPSPKETVIGTTTPSLKASRGTFDVLKRGTLYFNQINGVLHRCPPCGFAECHMQKHSWTPSDDPRR
jgi:hypothetical protein